MLRRKLFLCDKALENIRLDYYFILLCSDERGTFVDISAIINSKTLLSLDWARMIQS